MAGGKKSKNHPIDEDLDFQQKMWRIQRAGWVVLALLMLVTVLGLFGGGPLSSAQALDSSGLLQVDYDRFVRMQSPQTLQVSLDEAAVHDQQASVWVSQAFLDRVRVERIQPQPERVTAQDGGQIYQFSVRGPLQVTYDLQAKGPGVYRVELGLPGAEPAAFTQVVYP